MDRQMIPAEAVEAACAVMAAKTHGITIDEASADIWGYERWIEQEHALAVLTAAAPHLLASVWAEAMKMAAEVAWEHDVSASSAISDIPNPYKATK